MNPNIQIIKPNVARPQSMNQQPLQPQSLNPQVLQCQPRNQMQNFSQSKKRALSLSSDHIIQYVQEPRQKKQALNTHLLKSPIIENQNSEPIVEPLLQY